MTEILEMAKRVSAEPLFKILHVIVFTMIEHFYLCYGTPAGSYIA